MGDQVIDLLAEEWGRIGELAEGLSEEQWKAPIALEGWTVQDCVSHVAGVEASLLGDPTPEADIAHLSYVTGPFQQMIEVPVQHRRSWTGDQVLDDYNKVIARRVEALRSMPPERFDEISWSPIGEVPYRVFMGVRVFDCWMHEQDMRRALEQPGHLSGPVVQESLERFRTALPFIVVKRAGAPEGSVVLVETTGDTELDWRILVDAGKGRLATETDSPAGEPTVALSLPFSTLVALGGGRWSAGQAADAGGVTITGDTSLGERILANLAFTP